jgi:hypothetical protein
MLIANIEMDAKEIPERLLRDSEKARNVYLDIENVATNLHK